jgi:hypothetical protein
LNDPRPGGHTTPKEKRRGVCTRVVSEPEIFSGGKKEIKEILYIPSGSQRAHN